MWYVCDVLNAVLYVCVCYFVVRGCGVSRRYIYVCYCDMFSVVNVYFDNLRFYVACINGRRYVCCGECYVVSDECDEPTSCLVQPIVAHCCKVMYFGCFDFRGELGFHVSIQIQCTTIILYLELFDTASHACASGRASGHKKTLFQYSSLTPLEKECYGGIVQPYRKTDYKPMMMMEPAVIQGCCICILIGYN